MKEQPKTFAAAFNLSDWYFECAISAGLRWKVDATRLARLAPVFAEPFVLTQHPLGCLAAYSPARWHTIATEIEAITEQDPLLERLKRCFVGFAIDLSWGPGHSNEVPLQLLDAAGITGPTVLLVRGPDCAELWHEPRLIAAMAGGPGVSMSPSGN